MNKELETYMEENHLTPLKAFQKYREKDIKDFTEFTWIIKIIETTFEDYEELKTDYRELEIYVKCLEECGGHFFETSYQSQKKLKALNEILVLYDKWLGNEISDFEFFTQLNEITYKYNLLKEVLL